MSIAIYQLMDGLPGIAGGFSTDGVMSLGANSALAVLMLLPATLCIGATFPFAVRIYALDASHAGMADVACGDGRKFGADVRFRGR